MGKEHAAAILTQIYFDRVPGAVSKLNPPETGTGRSSQGIEMIGTIYGSFLSKMDAFPVLAAEMERSKF
jgi:hypothetical protein